MFNNKLSRRRFLGNFAFASAAIATGTGSWVIRPDWANAAEGPIKLGIATDLTGSLGYAGKADANVARMVVKEINDAGGLLGRPIELLIEDTATNESVAVGNVRKLIQRDKVDMVLGAITSSMRNAIKDVIVARGKTLYIYPQLYEGKECTPYLFCTGPTPAQQCDEFIPWLIKNGGKRFALPSANYIWPHTLNVYARKVIENNGGEVIFEEYYPLDQIEFSSTVSRIISNKVDVVFNTVIPPGVGPFFKQLYEAGFLKITDRKKDLLITSGGKNISPALVEYELQRHPLIGQACAIGDRRKYVSALLVLDPDVAPAWARERGIEFSSSAALAANPQVLAEIGRGVAEANAHLARPEQVRRYVVLPEEWTALTGELTPSLKRRRPVITQKYAREIASLYDE
ncbi:MAG: ABC transporter substrate-binding protein [Steroidobacteraceae bacterium]